MKSQPWIKSLSFDLIWFILPTTLPLIIILIFPQISTYNRGELNIAAWVLLILLIDVSHVYSTLYRTYFSKTGIEKYGATLKVIPIVCLIAGILSYAISPTFFWRLMAYTAVFHFIRQQYGFMRLYSRMEIVSPRVQQTITISIYMVTILPVLIWHTQGQKNFNWFMEGDFLYFHSSILESALKFTFFLSLLIYLFAELKIYLNSGKFNVPRFLLITGTAFSWYVGIVIFNADIVFSALNVIAHGIPYMALIWVTEKCNDQPRGINKYAFSKYGIIIFIGVLFVFAFLEEGVWDSLVWREHDQIFKGFYFMNSISNAKILNFIIPILTLPQLVHYVLDGFIWRGKKLVE